jgi:hypothetical protein
MIKWSVTFVCCLVTFLLSGPSAMAQTYDLVLGQRVLGWVKFTESQASNTLNLFAEFNNTPMGVMDGTFEASQKPFQADDGTMGTKYQRTSMSSKSRRVLTVLFEGGRPTSQWAEPPYRKAVGLSASEIPVATGDLLDAFTRVYHAQDCPGSFEMYEGHRLVRLTPQSRVERDGKLFCDMNYFVVLGPGHLAPFRFRSFDLTLVYAMLDEGQNTLARVDLRIGVFRASLLAR